MRAERFALRASGALGAAVICMMIMGGTAEAEGGEQGGMPMCDLISMMAKSTMSARQGNVALKDQLQAIGQSGLDGELKKVIEDIAIDAYEQPRYSTERMQKEAVGDFHNKWYLACVKAFR